MRRKPADPARVAARLFWERQRFSARFKAWLLGLSPRRLNTIALMCGWTLPPQPLTPPYKREHQRDHIVTACFKDPELRERVTKKLLERKKA